MRHSPPRRYISAPAQSRLTAKTLPHRLLYLCLHSHALDIRQPSNKTSRLRSATTQDLLSLLADPRLLSLPIAARACGVRAVALHWNCLMASVRKVWSVEQHCNRDSKRVDISEGNNGPVCTLLCQAPSFRPSHEEGTRQLLSGWHLRPLYMYM